MQAFAEQHATGEKRLLEYPGARAACSRPVRRRPQDLDDALDNIFNHPNVGPFIAQQLIQQLVTSNPSPAYVERVSAVFDDDGTGQRGNLGAVVRAILLDDEARARAARQRRPASSRSRCCDSRSSGARTTRSAASGTYVRRRHDGLRARGR